MAEKGHFAEVARFFEAGRFREAAGALKRAGAAAWETYLWVGRIEEHRGRLAEAEKAYRQALSANPTTPSVDLSRLLEKTGRAEEGRKILRTAAARAAGELPALTEGLVAGGAAAYAGLEFYSLMEFVPYRRSFMEALVRKGAGLARVERALRVATQPGARTLLSEVLIARRRLQAAEAELAPAFAAGAAGAETSRVQALLRLIENGRYGPVVERAMLDCLSRAKSGDKLVKEWPQVYSALMCSRRYPEAFRLGEAILDKFGRFESPGQLLWPWWRQFRRAVSEERFLDQELARIRAAGRKGGLPHWFAYYRAILLNNIGRNVEAMGEYKSLESLDAERYAWMFQSFVLVKLTLLDFEGAIEVSSAILKRAPSHWWVRCRMAEAYLAKGDQAGGLRQFERALATADPLVRGEVLTWYGEVLLWLGDYKGALAKLDEAVALGAKTFVHGWRGAARLKAGAAGKALADLDRAVALDAKDFEARGWRGEAYRILGRHEESRRDLDHVISSGPSNFWAHLNRALLRDAMGDAAGMKADFAAIPGDVTAFIAGRLKLPKDRALRPDGMREILTAGLDMAKGIRRWEDYVQPLWRGRPS